MHPGYLSAVSPIPIAPTPRRWYDRLADAVLGEDGDSTPGGAQNKYALICKKCFTHNGLVRESEVDETQFICMKCGFLNASPKSLRGEHHTPQTKDLSSRLSASPISPSPSLTASAMGPPAVPAGLASRKGYRVESDVEDNTDGADGMDVVPQTPAAKGAKGRKSSVAAAAGAAPGIKRSGSGRMTRNSRRSEVGEGMEVD
ncbi:hypothetical protein M408DRAFT_30053 [Serendipita vermifera MAFF 305830]|uniref:Endoplasmic reticulum junction formation protein lunapark n=1 Tax=Serendipita vermifera MAFF 305830 TaxID=933852 RepID=A0A0C3ALD3_SERVB|nr:hypothetical protein M408DRAFT_30053 [Serendipita vermifera MAFF 305830]